MAAVWQTAVVRAAKQRLAVQPKCLYFYLLYPLYILLSGWFLSTHLTSLLFHLVILVLGSVFLAKQGERKLLNTFLIVFAFGAIHPEMVTQQRYIWNPSFVWLPVIIASISFYQLQKQFLARWLWIFALSITFAVAMSVSAGPALLAFLLVALFVLRKHFLKLVGAVFLAGNFWFLPYWFFELRYNFQIIKRVLGRQVLVMDSSRLSTVYQLESLGRYLLDLSLSWWLVLAGIILVLASAVYLSRSTISSKKEISLGALVTWLFVITSAISLIFPVTIEAHYIFPVLAFSHLLMAELLLSTSRKIKALALVLCLMLASWWLRPGNLRSYFKPAPRSYDQLERCFSKVCAFINEPVFSSTQSMHYRYHTGPEFRYMMLRHGCQMKHIERDNQAASLMAVIADQSSYVHGETAFDELSLFGDSVEEKVFYCENEMAVHLLRRQAGGETKQD